MKNFLIGIIAGIGNITPGISGSALLIIFNVYDKCLYAISNVFKNFKKYFLYLLPIGLGIILGTYLFSNIINYFITNYENITRIVFAFFIIGTIPSLINKVDKKSFNIKSLIPFIITFILGILLLLLKPNNNIIIDTSFKSSMILLLSGILLACSTIIPGISSTILLNIIGVYKTYLLAIKNLNIAILIPIGIGLLVGIFILSKVINYLLKKYYNYTFFAILGFVISTIPTILPKSINLNKEFLISIFLGITASFLSYSIEKGLRP